MEVSKIHLSATEYQLMQNADIILTKNSVLNKMKWMLEQVQEKQMEFVTAFDLNSSPLFKVSPKISRGENYLGLPWLILDHPRLSGEEGLFFIRTMFWWGRFFSSTLHVSGIHKEKLVGPISGSYKDLKEYYLGINEDPWAHHFDESNYRPVSSMDEKDFQMQCRKVSHLKIASSLPLTEWQDAPAILFERWKFLLGLGGSIA